jgi:hypothetical protein
MRCGNAITKESEMPKLSENFSRNAYAAAYNGLNEKEAGKFDNGFDVVGWRDDEDARPVMAGVAPGGAFVIFSNVSESDFGSSTIEDFEDEDEFVDMCMDCFGCVEFQDED